jgi:hypothetical protein
VAGQVAGGGIALASPNPSQQTVHESRLESVWLKPLGTTANKQTNDTNRDK